MNSKSILLIAGICSTTWLGSVFSQGSGGAGGGAGAAGGTGGSSGAAATAGTGTGTTGAGTAAGAATAGAANRSSNVGASSSIPAAPGAKANRPASTVPGGTAATAPDTSSSMPSRSVLNTATPPDGRAPSTADRSNLPEGLSVPAPQPGVSPLSGLPVAEIPVVSRGTAPIGARSDVGPALPTATEVEARRDAALQPKVTDPAAIAAHPQTNPQIGMGTTTVVPTPPPAAQPEAAPATATNDLGQIWVAGHYSWVNGQWTWVNGMWQRPPQPNATWAPGNYDAQTKRWTEGHWVTGAPDRR